MNLNTNTIFTLTYLPNPYTDKKVTEMQLKFLEALPDCDFDPKQAAIVAGYPNHFAVVKALRNEIHELVAHMTASNSLKAVKALGSVLDGEGASIPNLKEVIDVAKDTLDRAGHSKNVNTTVDVNLNNGGLFILPTKKPIDVEYEEIE